MVHSFSVLIPLIVYLFIIVGEDGFGPSVRNNHLTKI
jgi:hypothetical protein